MPKPDRLLLLMAVLAGPLPAAEQDLLVTTVTARSEPLALDMQLSGQIEAVDTLELGFRQGGRVTEVLVAEGDRVAAGQPLARLNAVQQDQALNAADAGLAAARAGVEQARRFARYPGVVERAAELGLSCAFDLALVAPDLPPFPCPDGLDEMGYLRVLAERGGSLVLGS